MQRCPYANRGEKHGEITVRFLQLKFAHCGVAELRSLSPSMPVRVAGAESMATAHDHSPQCVRGGAPPATVVGDGTWERVGSGQDCAANDSMGYAILIGTRVPSLVW